MIYRYTDLDGDVLEVGVNWSFGPPSVTLYTKDNSDGQEGAVRLPVAEWRKLVDRVEMALAAGKVAPPEVKQ